MSTEQNKAVVRRFITETLAGGNVDVIDEQGEVVAKVEKRLYVRKKK